MFSYLRYESSSIPKNRGLFENPSNNIIVLENQIYQKPKRKIMDVILDITWDTLKNLIKRVNFFEVLLHY